MKIQVHEAPGYQFKLEGGVAIVGVVRALPLDIAGEIFIVDDESQRITGWSVGCCRLFNAPTCKKNKSKKAKAKKKTHTDEERGGNALPFFSYVNLYYYYYNYITIFFFDMIFMFSFSFFFLN